MSNYTKITDFAIKDGLATGDPNKVIVGTEHDDEYNAISTAIATKLEIPNLLTAKTTIETEDTFGLWDAAAAAVKKVTFGNLMKFLPAGAGAVSTTVQAKLRERVSVLDFGADPTGAANSLTEVQAAYNFVANQDGGEVYWPKGSYTINGTIYFGANTRTDLGKSTITGNGSVLFATGYLSGGALAANFGTANNCDKSSIENGTIYNTNGIAFKLTNFRFYCYLSNIVCYDVAQIAVGDSCFYSDYRNLIYFGATDFVKSTATTTSASAVIVVTNAVAATLSAGMKIAAKFVTPGATIASVGAPDSGGAGFTNVTMSDAANSNRTSGGVNSGFSCALNPVGLYEFSGASSDLTFTKCSAASNFYGFVLSSVASTSFISCDIESVAYGFKIIGSSANNSYISTHTETVSGYIWDYSECTSNGSLTIDGFNSFNIAGTVTAGSSGFVTGTINLPQILSAYTPYGFSSHGEALLDLSSPNARCVVVGGGVDNTELNAGCKSTFIRNGITLPNIASTAPYILDWYEEGVDVANVSISGSTTAGTATYSTRSCRWQRIGNRVHVNIELVWTGHTGTGYTLLTELPYTPGTNYKQSLSVDRHATIAFTAGNNLGMAMPGSSSTAFDLWQSVQGGASVRIACPAAGSLSISGSYEV